MSSLSRIITTRQQPSHILSSIVQWRRLAGNGHPLACQCFHRHFFPLTSTSRPRAQPLVHLLKVSLHGVACYWQISHDLNFKNKSNLCSQLVVWSMGPKALPLKAKVNWLRASEAWKLYVSGSVTHFNIYMSAGFLMVIPHVLVGERLATPSNPACEKLQLLMACLHMLGQVWFLQGNEDYFSSKSAKQLTTDLKTIAMHIWWSNNITYIGKGAFTTLKGALHPFTRGHLAMGL